MRHTLQTILIYSFLVLERRVHPFVTFFATNIEQIIVIISHCFLSIWIIHLHYTLAVAWNDSVDYQTAQTESDCSIQDRGLCDNV